MHLGVKTRVVLTYLTLRDKVSNDRAQRAISMDACNNFFRSCHPIQRLRGSTTLIAVLALCSVSTAVRADVPVDLNSFRGRVVYLDFWASWCAPCRQSFPWMQEMQETYGRQGLAIVAVDVDKSQSDAQKFLAEFHPTFDVRFDPKGELAEHFHVQGMPTGLAIDRRGVVRFTHLGFRPVDRAAYENQLRELLNEK
jgi:cytochrome c biogenesis protein CcmG/thiol:disulfide interchange protein DsbE